MAMFIVTTVSKFSVNCCLHSSEFLLQLWLNMFLFSVDEDDDFECAGVLSIHTQDVKDVAWHPHEDVR